MRKIIVIFDIDKAKPGISKLFEEAIYWSAIEDEDYDSITEAIDKITDK